MVLAQVLLSPDDFADDLENLGRANGNILHRVAGVQGIHDGQVMVRLKKKRFVILDYSIIPNEVDRELATTQSHIKIPKHAGQAICSKPECPKIGIPVCLFDSSPSEQDPLYLRVGLCFQCQRNLNEQRRSDKKRPGKALDDYNNSNQSVEAALFGATLGTQYKKQKGSCMSGGRIERVRPWSVGYGFREMGPDLLTLTQEGAHDVARLLQLTAIHPGYPPPHINNCPTTDTTMTSTVGLAEAIAEAVDESTKSYNQHHQHPPHQHPCCQVGNVDQAGVSTNEDSSDSTHDDMVQATYVKAVQSINKSLYLLSQWKLSWDAVASHISTGPTSESVPAVNTVVGVTTVDQSVMLFHDAVASAAAVAAMTSTPTTSSATANTAPPTLTHAPAANTHVTPIVTDWPDTLASLLLAADQSNDNYITGSSSEPHNVWHFQHERNGREEDQDDTSHGVGAFD